MFPFPGDTAEPDEWARAFTLEGSHTAPTAPFFSGGNGAVSVNGQPTLWRQVPVPPPSSFVEVSRDSVMEINLRLDKLTKQLEELGSGSVSGSSSGSGSGSKPGPDSWTSNNADLFLFVAIGLLFLLALDTLLRFATSRSGSGSGSGSVSVSRQMGGRRVGMDRWRGGGGRWRAPRYRTVFV